MSDAHSDPEAERRLLERFRGGDEAAFREIVLLHRAAVYRVARRILGSHEEADEVAQETFVRAWKGLHAFRGDSRLSTWLMRIAIRLGRETGATRRRTVTLPLDEAAIDPGIAADESLGRARARRRVREAVRSLPPRQREVVALKVFSEMTYEDVATSMGLTVGAVKAHLHQAVANLRRRMAEEGSGR